MLPLIRLLCLPLVASAAFLDNATVTIASDVDDILRVTEVWNLRRAIRNVFTEPFEPLQGMTELYRDYAQVNGTQFAYITDALTTWGESYISGIPQYYPNGSVQVRELRLAHLKSFLSFRQISIQKLIDQDTNQKFVLVGDFATPGLSDAYARLALKNPRQVQCLFMFDVRATNPADVLVPATKLLSNKKLANRWTVFETAADFHQESLAYLRRLNDTTDENFGCESLLYRQKAFLDLLHNKHINSFGAMTKTIMNMFVTQMQCLMLSPWRPSPQCRYDRREGTWYPRHKKFESGGRLQDWKSLPDTVINGTRYDRMCHDDGKFYVVKGVCPDFSTNGTQNA